MPEPRWQPQTANDQPIVAFRIRAMLRMRIPARKRKEARRILASLIERIRLEDGCLGCRLYLDALEKGGFMLEEIWGNENSFEKHLRSDEFRTVLLVVEMASGPPDIRFERVGFSTGMETIQTIRSQRELCP